MGRRTGQKFDVELVFICAAFHDLGLLKKFSSANDRFEVDGANAVRQFLEHCGVPDARIQTAWDAISLHTTPGIAAYKPLEVELLYNGVALDSLGVGYETFPEDVRTRVVSQFPRVNFKQEITEAFFHGFEHKPETTESLEPPAFPQLQEELRRFFAPVIAGLSRPEAARGRWDPDTGAWAAS